ncbi:MAG TPA: hypothetical protein VES42_00070, partial [Pilimelia sp.]|nr:hypothetical protein [Pilimelia sp.]
MTSLRRLRAAALAVPLLLIATACAQPTPGSGDDAGGGTGAGSLAADALVLRVVHVGGFVSAEMLASRLPLVSVYGDGRVVTEGPITLQYPGPALPNLQLQRISTADVEGLVERAVAAGVGAAPAGGYGRPPIADAPDTRFTVLTDDGPKVSEVYALAEARDGGSGLTAEQVSARKRLSGLLASLTDLPGTLGRDAVTAAGPYRATEVVALA